MIPEIKIIQQLAYNAIFEVRSSSESDIKAWLANQDYFLSQPLSSSHENRVSRFNLQIKNLDFLTVVMANECNRFAQAAIESMWSISSLEKIPKSTGWTSIQLYYASFFSAHAMLRLFGRACSQLDNTHTNKIHEVAVATSMDAGVRVIESGFYKSSINSKEFCFEKVKDSHADTWNSFSNLLSWMISEIPNTTGINSHKILSMELLEKIKNSLSKSGAPKGNWPSIIRNKVNYQHTHGVWYPYKGALHDHRRINDNLAWLKNPSFFDLNTNGNDIDFLFSLSNTILSLMYQLILFGHTRAGSKSVPFSNGLFRLVNQLDVA